MIRKPVVVALAVLSLALSSAPGPGASPASAPTDSTVITDSLYASLHPRLLFSSADIPALKSKMTDGGRDDMAFLFIQAVELVKYPVVSFDDMLGFNEHPIPDFGLEAFPNLGLAAHLSEPAFDHAREIGRQLTLHIADTWDVDSDVFGSSLRLRALCLGYDMFLRDSDEAERGQIRDEILSYLGFMVYRGQYRVWEWRPYLSNKTAMLAASIGLASIVLRGAADDVLLDVGMARADFLIEELLEHQWDPDGAAREGVLYGAWSLRNLVYYFEARRGYDGFDYSQNDKLRRTERWLAYELDPADPGRVNNIQDCTATDYPLARHTTYLDWAQARWQSGLAAYIWDQAASSPDGYDVGDQADKAATALWAGDLPRQTPGEVLPPSFLWEKRGLYYFRTGWPAGVVSDDVVFSLYAGRFEGGHQQEDQGQFTLTAFGARFAMDHGPGGSAKQSEAHNIVLIDGSGQHNAGSAIGTDAAITSWLIGDFWDVITCDLTQAYSTYSPHNALDTPYEGADWSWGYQGANPVLSANRTVMTVRAPGADPYFIILDDINKDGLPHEYAWRLHTEEGRAVDVSQNPLVVSDDRATMDIHVVYPRFSAVERSVTPFDNGGIDPNSQLISLETHATNPGFSVMLMPRLNDGGAGPNVRYSAASAGGGAATIAWGDGTVDVVAINRTNGSFSVTAGPVPFSTDASVAVVRFRNLAVEGYGLSTATTLRVGGVEHVRFLDAPATLSHFGGVVHLDRPDAQFAFSGLGVAHIRCRERELPFVEHDGVFTPGLPTIAPDTPPAPARLRVSAFPNPMTPSSDVVIDVPVAGRVVAEIYNARGQRVRHLFKGDLAAGSRMVAWDGRGDGGETLASGVYFIRVSASGEVKTVKVAIVR